jgi:hypothetical protein
MEAAILDYMSDEVLLQIMYNMDGDILLKFCSTGNKRISDLCNDELFWKQNINMIFLIKRYLKV